MLLSMKGQLAEHLHRRQFLQSADVLDRAANVNSNNEALVRAVLCAGLYPNVAKIRWAAGEGRSLFQAAVSENLTFCAVSTFFMP
jgi:ATP-dependent RNA helicase DHX36